MAIEIHGPYGYLIKPIGLMEDAWYLSSDPDDSDDVDCVPLYATFHQMLGDHTTLARYQAATEGK